jgi:hypothetical protein
MDTKKEFFDHMSKLLGEKYRYSHAYDIYKEIYSTTDKKVLAQMYDLTQMNDKERKVYRTALACQGLELTPSQVDQFLLSIDYALKSRTT